jgi:predicted RNase H-like HicB family nuclease
VTPTLVAGGLTGDASVQVTADEGQRPMMTIRYAQPRPVGSSYPIFIAPRLSAVVEQGAETWTARVPELNGLGYGETSEQALEMLRESLEQYLEYLRDEKPDLAPEIAHHAAFIHLLKTPPMLWFASVSVHAAPLE